MTNSAQDLAFNPDSESSEYRVPKREGSVLKTPDAANPLVCKVLANPLRDNEAYYQVDLIKHMVGPDPKKDTRYHLSRRMLGDKAPEVDAYWDAHNQLKTLKEKKNPTKEEAAEVRRLEQTKALFAVSNRFLLLVLPAGDTKPRVLEVTRKAIKKLFGADAYGKEPAYVGCIPTMKSKGRDPGSLKSETGWIKIWRTGTGLETDWHVQEATVEVKIDGEDVIKPMKQPVNPAVFSLKKSDLPDVTKVHQTAEKLWSAEECQAFVDSFATVIPDRCKRRQFSGGADTQKSDDEAVEAPVSGEEEFDLNSIF